MMMKKNMDCPHCKYKFITLVFPGVKSVYCHYCRNRVIV